MSVTVWSFVPIDPVRVKTAFNKVEKYLLKEKIYSGKVWIALDIDKISIEEQRTTKIDTSVLDEKNW